MIDIKKSQNSGIVEGLTEYIDEFGNAISVVQSKADRINAYRREASRLASKANKRIERLEKNDLTDSPAYKTYVEGKGRFGVKGKTYNELQSEVSRLNNFINSNTSTIRGINSNLKDMAKNTGIKYKNLKDLRRKSAKFFELASKVEQYLRTVEDMASAIGYQKIWEAINQYTKASEIDLSSGEADIESMIGSVTEALKAYESPTKFPNGDWYKLSDQ